MAYEDQTGEDWEGDERRECKRRFNVDRRNMERKKRYFFGILMPIIIGVVLTGIVSWGAYVTHVTYKISANYEETFVKHMGEQNSREVVINHRLDLMTRDYGLKVDTLRSEVTEGLREIREVQSQMYRLLVQYQTPSSNDDKN